ncbi:MAG: N-acetylmuramoyl-L-alanine amidase, partial [Actinomycetota bacterium]
PSGGIVMQIISRSEWGAAPPRGTYTPAPWPPGLTLWLHHTVGHRVDPFGPGMPGPRWLRVLRAPARYPADLVRKVRMQRALAVAARERTVEAECAAMRAIQWFHQKTRKYLDIGYGLVAFPSGRVYQGRPPETAGAHCPGHNHEPSVALAGDYTRTAPSPAQVAAVKALMRHLRCRDIRGHRDGYPTACPGDAAIAAFGLG